MKKRILALILSGCMVFSMTTMPTKAEEAVMSSTVVEDTEEEDSNETDLEEDYIEAVSSGSFIESVLDGYSDKTVSSGDTAETVSDGDSDRTVSSGDMAETVSGGDSDETVSSGDAAETVSSGDTVGTELSGGAEEAETAEPEPESEQWVEVTLPGGSFTADVDLPDNDTLFAGYLQRQMYVGLNGGISTYGNFGETGLSGNSRALYQIIKREIQKVASGERTSTEMYYRFDQLGLKTEWTAAELGLTTLTENNQLTDAASKVINREVIIDYRQLLNVLLVDCPYDFYWFDKTKGYGYYPFQYNYSADKVWISTSMTGYSFTVAGAYQLNNDAHQVNPAFAQNTQAVVTTAQGIVKENAGKSDYEKLIAYRDAICELTEYNHSAADNKDTPYGDPWQLIWIFDGDPDTTVVCEGYAKAFQYLCDLTEFDSDIRCYTVTGMMYGGTGAGGHMWNIVTMEDGKNYLVDVTNSDKGTVGQTGGLFLSGYNSGSVATDYTFVTNSGVSIRYVYDSEDRAMYGDEILTISDTDYTPVTRTSIAGAEATLTSSNGFVYNGKEHKPAVSVMLDGKELKQDEDYTVDYENNINAGTATVTIKGIGNYTGTVKKTFEIGKATPSYVQPTGLKAVYGQTLKDVVLPSGWSWKDSSTSVGNVGDNSFPAVYTPEDTSNYNTVTVTLTVTVSKVQTTLKILDAYAAGKIYDGEAAAAPKEAELSLVGAEYQDVKFSWEVSQDDGSWKALAEGDVPVDAGTYRLTASIAEAENTTAASDSVKITISKKSVQANVTVQDKTYDGTETATLVVTVPTYARDTLTVTGVTGTFSDKNAGTGKSVSVDSRRAAVSGTGADNYEITYPGTASGNITKRSLELTNLQVTADNKVYDGSDEATVHAASGTTWAGAVDVFAEGTDYTVSGKFDDVNAGTGKTVTVTVTLMGIAEQNYELAANSRTVTANITKAPLTVTAKDCAIEYGNIPGNDGVTYKGFVAGEDDGVLNGKPTYTYNYEQYGDVGTYTITPGGLTGDNYNITFATGTLTVKPKEVTLVWQNVDNRYHGDGLTVTASVSESSLVNGDKVYVTVKGGDANTVGSYTATATGLTGEKAGNYRLSGNANKEYTIAMAASNIQNIKADKAEYTYGDVIIVTATLNIPAADLAVSKLALFYGDTPLSEYVEAVDGVFTMKYNTADKNVPAGEQQRLTVRFNGSEGVASAEGNISVLISAKQLTVTLIGNASKEYDGNKDAEGLKAELSGVVDKDQVTTSLKLQYENENAGDNKTVTAEIELVGQDAQWYKLEESKVSKTGNSITPKMLEWDTSYLRANKYQDGRTDLQLIGNLKLKGVLGSDDPQFTYSLTVGDYPSAEAGEYDITVTVTKASLGNANYTLPKEMEFTVKGRIIEVQQEDSIVTGEDGIDMRFPRDYDFAVIPQELMEKADENGYDDPAEWIRGQLRNELTSHTGYTAANSVYYDQILQISYDEGETWINVTKDNFPEGGITITLDYPEGTGMNTHDFVVTHMLGYAVGDKEAGDIETLAVTKTAKGLKVTLYSLSPIGIAWKAKSTNNSNNTNTPGNQTTGGTGSQETADTKQEEMTAPKTGEYVESFGFLKGVGLAALCGSAVMFAVGALGERVLYRRKRSRKNSRDIK